jgi:hypothetical protein
MHSGMLAEALAQGALILTGGQAEGLTAAGQRRDSIFKGG